MSSTDVARIRAGGRSIAYREAGRGPALVLLHGFLCDSRVWEAQLADLSDRFRVLAWDAPGAGASPDPPDPFTITDWAHCLAEFLDAVGVEGAHVLGLSWGGLLAQELYRLEPSRFLGLILADTYAGWKGSLGEEAAGQRLARCVRESALPAEEFVARWVPVEFFTEAVSGGVQEQMAAVVRDFHPLGFRLMAKALADSDTTELLAHIAVPALLLWGEDDKRSPLSVAERFRDAIPEAKLEVIPEAGHISNMEQPETFNAHVRRFTSARPT
jgi:pimeloyl-ACP methyl ester carboxylesterase